MANTTFNADAMLEAFCAASVVFVVAGCAATAVQVSVGEASTAELVERFKSCAGPFGVHGAVAKLRMATPPETAGERITLSDTGIVSDGFSHKLLIDRTRSVVSLHETGGIAGVSRYYCVFH